MRRRIGVVAMLVIVFGGCSDDAQPASEFGSVPGEAAPRLSASVFTTDRGCRWEFATGDDNGNWRLHVTTPDQRPIPPGAINLEEAVVTATVTAGRDLFANYCDDVIEVDQPIAVPFFEWPVVAGTFEMPSYNPEVRTSLTITLRWAIVETDVGPIALDPIEITNDCFGCLI